MALDKDLPPAIKRVGLLIEMADGTTVAVYAEPAPNTPPWEPEPTVTLGMERPTEEADLYAPGDRRGGHRTVGPPIHYFHVDGIQEYRAATAMPAMIGATLDAIRNAVTL